MNDPRLNLIRTAIENHTDPFLGETLGAAQARARFAATVDLPTPPLPEATAMMFLTPGRGFNGRWTACAWICELS